MNPFRRAWLSLTSARGFRRVTAFNMSLLWLIIPSGAVVRLTGSGLGCTDWPLCDAGGILPANSQHAWIEYSNRMFSGVVMLVAILAAILAFWATDASRVTRFAALTAAVATIGQIPLGAVTVVFDLHPLLVASHFLLSLVALAAGTIAFLGSDDVVRGITRRVRTASAWLGGLFAAALVTTVVTGVLVTTAGPHSGDPQVVKRFGMLYDAAYVHVRAVAALLLVGIIVGWLIRRRRDDRGLIVPALLFIPFFIAQVVVGEVQWRNQLPAQWVIAHVSIAGIIWLLGVTIAWRVARPITSRAAG